MNDTVIAPTNSHELHSLLVCFFSGMSISLKLFTTYITHTRIGFFHFLGKVLNHVTVDRSIIPLIPLPHTHYIRFASIIDLIRIINCQTFSINYEQKLLFNRTVFCFIYTACQAFDCNTITSHRQQGLSQKKIINHFCSLLSLLFLGTSSWIGLGMIAVLVLLNDYGAHACIHLISLSSIVVELIPSDWLPDLQKRPWGYRKKRRVNRAMHMPWP